MLLLVAMGFVTISRGSGLRQFEDSNPTRFVLSVDDNTDPLRSWPEMHFVAMCPQVCKKGSFDSR